MSRLDAMILRLQAQRAVLDDAASRLAGLPGPVLELGLGNGRTYDHLRQIFPGRDIFVFDREIAAHPDCVPPPEFQVLGDFRQTLAAAGARIGRPAAFVHADIGTADAAASARLAADILPDLVALLAPGGLLAGDQPMDHPALEPLDLPAGAAPGRYRYFRRRPG